MNVASILQIVTIGSGILMVLAILLQARGASLGAGFGSSGELFDDPTRYSQKPLRDNDRSIGSVCPLHIG